MHRYMLVASVIGYLLNVGDGSWPDYIESAMLVAEYYRVYP